ncbi:MAG: hypothetical protein R3E89_14780 [Thiolinea sp.]
MLTFRANIDRWDYFYALIAGLLLVFAFAPFAWRPLAWLSPALFFWLNLKPMLRGSACACPGVTVSACLPEAPLDLRQYPFFRRCQQPDCSPDGFLFVLLVALPLMLFGWLAHFYPYQARWSKLLLVFPAIWGLTEAFLGWFLTGFPCCCNWDIPRRIPGWPAMRH